MKPDQERQPSDVFDPVGITWTSVSPRLAAVRRTVLLVLLAVVAIFPLAGLVFWRQSDSPRVIQPDLAPLWIALVGLALAAVFGWRAIGRQVASWGYAERADDLLVRRGVVFRQLVVVPYGRMQFVDVQAGPLERAFGVAQVQLHTAAASSDARIPGLSVAEAARLRDRLASRGQAQLAGL